MKEPIHTYKNLESSVEVLDDGEIQTNLSDCAHTSLYMSIDPEPARKIYEALKKVFDNQTTPKVIGEDVLSISPHGMSLPDAYDSVLGGVSAISPDLYGRALQTIADRLGRVNDEAFRAEVREYEVTLPCDFD